MLAQRSAALSSLRASRSTQATHLRILPAARTTTASPMHSPATRLRHEASHSSTASTDRRGATMARASADGNPAIRREVLSRSERTKLNPERDTLFYEQPRFVTHVDDNFLAQLTQLYRERIPEGAAVLDLMSSWVSHLPRDRRYGTVYGHGMNEKELLANDQLDEVFLADLNRDPAGWPVKDGELDAVICCVSVQYLQRPEEVFAEIARVLKPGGVAIMSFSNRMFPDKAIAAWRDSSDYAHVSLVKSYFQAIDGFGAPELVTEVKLPEQGASGGLLEGLSRKLKQMLAGGYQDPFFAVIASKTE